MSADSFRRVARTALTALLWCAAAGLLVQNWLLAHENRGLNARLKAGPVQIESGRKLSGLSGITARGELKSLPVPAAVEDKLLIITFSPGCPAYKKNVPGWMALTKAVEKRGWRVAWMSRDPVDYTNSYALSQGVDPAIVLADPPMRTYSQLGLELVPRTIVVGPDGVIQQAWVGELTRDKWSQIFSYFKISEPAFLSVTDGTPSTASTRPSN